MAQRGGGGVSEEANIPPGACGSPHLPCTLPQRRAGARTRQPTSISHLSGPCAQHLQEALPVRVLGKLSGVGLDPRTLGFGIVELTWDFLRESQCTLCCLYVRETT